MPNVRVISGRLLGPGRSIAIVAARFNEFVVDALVDGAVEQLLRHGVAEEHITVVRVPGAFELPPVVRRVALSGAHHGVIALGAVIRGATPHFDHVAGNCAAGIARIACEVPVPVIFGVLTTDTIEQAIERAGAKAGNKGADAAVAVLEMVDLAAQLGGG
jgi:6,7-dimethyl-8-ribityllumazine synthase